MPPVSLLIKPASSNCNMRCNIVFTFFSRKQECKILWIMDIETWKFGRKTLNFSMLLALLLFRVGTLADCARKLIEFQRKYNKKGIKINNTIQTNGMVIDEECAKYLSDNDFLVGLSLDGTKDIHDMNRVDSRNKGTFNRVMKTVDLFNKHKVEYNILFVVNSGVARRITKIYNFFKRNGFRFIQFIPCLDPLGEQPGRFPYSLTPERFAGFLKTLFDAWYTDIKKGNMISIRYFDNLVGMIMGYPPENCGMSGICQVQFVVEADGGVYPCDFYVLDEWCMGNLKTQELDELRESQAARDFVEV